MMNDENIRSFDEMLKKSGRKSLIKAAKLARQTDTALVIRRDDAIAELRGAEIDRFLENLPPEEK